ncbi:EAL domain-containing protein [Lactococcus taiwanensis]|uniref:EAL domain-containing protein n=1 Tax=Lactococcus taiwanensis TaxID=1151742 RepID=UPI001963DF72|nr:EAL domain-containing protein [Lactococcus taiwanensis]QRZ11925.1 EAL domain-containing protein [Lactococcus taiwanensis]
MEVSQEIGKLCYFRQRIYKENQGYEEYELLLRYKKGDNYYFPQTLFTKILSYEIYHKLYMTHIGNLLREKLRKDTNTYTVNFDYQELNYSHTIEFLENFEFKDRLKIEITENFYKGAELALSDKKFIDKLIRLKDLGYEFALDDFLTGINSYEFLFTLREVITRVKISVLKFKKFLDNKELAVFLSSIVESFSFLGKEIVIEAVENEKLFALFPREWYQQTFYYSKPHPF